MKKNKQKAASVPANMSDMIQACAGVPLTGRRHPASG